MKLDRVEVEADGIEEEEYQNFLGDYLQSQAALRQSRALSRDVRYLVFRAEDTFYAIEEQGEWRNGNYEPSPENDYRKVYRNRTQKVKEEEIDWENAQELLVDYSNFSA